MRLESAERKARVRWLPPEVGGRTSPPSGPQYSTVARFERLAGKWPREAWSIVLYINTPADCSGLMLAEISLLSDDEAAQELLAPGNRFELFEGRSLVARGEVL